jgi:hypothetical protein
MEELLGGLLAMFLEVFGEALFQLAAEVIVALADRSIRRGFHEVVELGESGPIKPIFAVAGYLSLGTVFGFASLMLFPHPLFHPSRFHGVSLLVSPVLTGLAMSLMGMLRRKKGKQAARIESFGYGFTFALGMAIMRFLFVA